MKILKTLVVSLLLVPTLFVSGCGKNADQAATGQDQSATSSSASDSLPWSSLNANQKSVLSVGEDIWSKIPVEKRQAYLAIADNWNQTEAADQFKMLNEVRDYANLPHIGPDANKKSKK